MTTRRSIITWGSFGLKAFLLLLVIHASVTRDVIFTFIGIICFGLALVPPLLGRRVWLPAECDACVTTILVAHVFLGMTLELYETSPIYDKVSHYTGTLMLSWLALRIVDRQVNVKGAMLPSGLRSILLLLFAVGIGTMWEILEFLIDQTDLVIAQRGLADTMYDLMADLLAGMTVGLLSTYRVVPQPGARHPEKANAIMQDAEFLRKPPSHRLLTG